MMAIDVIKGNSSDQITDFGDHLTEKIVDMSYIAS